jgi:transcriptional regulator with XRE-family HTH domain
VNISAPAVSWSRLRVPGLHIGRRRVPGLRGDELSLLAGVSTDYYVRLEQGRDRNPSPQVLDALARAPQLDDQATAHLDTLAGHQRRAPRSAQRPERVPPSIEQLIAGWQLTPAYVQGRRLDVLAANPLATVVSPQFTPGVNLLRAAFLDPAVRALYGDHWESLAHSMIAGVRALLGPDVDDPVLDELVGELSVRSDHFRTLWARHDIRARTSGGGRHMHHPRVGELELHYENLLIAGTVGQTLIIYHADPGSPRASTSAPLHPNRGQLARQRPSRGSQHQRASGTRAPTCSRGNATPSATSNPAARHARWPARPRWSRAETQTHTLVALALL